MIRIETKKKEAHRVEREDFIVLNEEVFEVVYVYPIHVQFGQYFAEFITDDGIKRIFPAEFEIEEHVG